MKKIAVLTSIRSEYGLLKPLLNKIKMDSELELQLIVTGAHLSPTHGYTIKEIIQDQFEIADQISYLGIGISKADRAKEMGILMIQLANTLDRLKPDMLILLGDRYESLGAAMVAMTMNIPLGHIAGGEQTEGAIDEQVRHALTKMAHLHFAEAGVYANNIIQMGEESWRVHNVGALGIENIETIPFLDDEVLEESIGMKVDRDTLLITYHPVTLEYDYLPDQMDHLLGALEKLQHKMLITYPNIDQGGEYIIERIEAFAKDKAHVTIIKNLGVQRYLSVMKRCGAVVGNSSSALIEAPYLKIPVVNIGNRQKGRLMADNIIQCSNDEQSILESIRRAMNDTFTVYCQQVSSLYGQGNTSTMIVDVLKNTQLDEQLLKKKLVWR